MTCNAHALLFVVQNYLTYILKIIFTIRTLIYANSKKKINKFIYLVLLYLWIKKKIFPSFHFDYYFIKLKKIPPVELSLYINQSLPTLTNSNFLFTCINHFLWNIHPRGHSKTQARNGTFLFFIYIFPSSFLLCNLFPR